MERPVYGNQPIRSVAALCRALGTPEGLLRSLAERIPQLYIGPKPKLKKDGKSFRNVYDTKPPLKPLLKKINAVVFENVIFPLYLQGSLKEPRLCQQCRNSRGVAGGHLRRHREVFRPHHGRHRTANLARLLRVWR